MWNNTITYYHFSLIALFFVCSCDQKLPVTSDFFQGVDLSYLNEMEDCGAIYRENGKSVEPYNFFAEKGSNIVRVRLWHNPEFGQYSNLKDVSKTIQKARKQNQAILLDFHYSDTWADPGKQVMPKAWQKIKDQETLGDSLYNYTYYVLSVLHQQGLSPELVQIGNETNNGFVEYPETNTDGGMNWSRNAYLFNKGIEAVNDFNAIFKTKTEILLHVAQPENALEWFQKAQKNGITQYQWIGLSYYPNWSKYDLNHLGNTIRSLDSSFAKKIMIVETAYPYTTQSFDQANNIMTGEGALARYPVSPEGQLSFMLDLKNTVSSSGGKGVIYWEPTWVSTSCKTQWGTGSHWENATFFDAANENEALPVFNFFNQLYN